MSLQNLVRRAMPHSSGLSQVLCSSQVVSQRGLVTSMFLQKGLTEGSPTREAAMSGFSRLRQNVSNIMNGNNGQLQGEDKVDRWQLQQRNIQMLEYPATIRHNVAAQIEYEPARSLSDKIMYEHDQYKYNVTVPSLDISADFPALPSATRD